MSFLADTADAMEEATHRWLAFGPCGCLVFSLYDLRSTDPLRQQTERALADLERAGRTLVLVPVSEAADVRIGCVCGAVAVAVLDRRGPHRAPPSELLRLAAAS